jgi:ABC-type Fe3+/spermidine/putrescine transport system ATPase subunit
MKDLMINDISKHIGKTQILSKVNLSVDNGELLCLLGPSGCGKSSLLRIIAGLDWADSGDIIYGGESWNDMPPEARNIGFVFQRYALFPNLTALGNVLFGLEMKHMPKRETASLGRHWLESVGLKGLENRYPHELSGGQQQRVALARALAPEPEILLLDEPLSALDASIRISLRSEIKKLLLKLGVTTIFVTHDQSEALAISDRIAVMNEGTIVEVARAEILYDEPESLFSSSFIGTTTLLDGRVVSLEPPLIDLGECVVRVEALDPRAAIGLAATVMFRAEDVELMDYGGRRADFNCFAGTIGLASYMGNGRRCEIRLRDGRTVNADSRKDSDLDTRPGRSVLAFVPPEKLRVFDGKSGESLSPSAGRNIP